MDRIMRERCVFFLMFMLIPSIAFAGFNVCPNVDGEISSIRLDGNPINGCHYFQHEVDANFDSVKALLKSVRRDFLLIQGKDVVEKTTAAKNAILQAEIDSAAAQQCVSLDSLDITLKQAFVAWLQVYNSKVPSSRQVSNAELKAQVLTNAGVSCP